MNIGFIRSVAWDISDEELSMDDAMGFCRMYFENWSDYECDNRPVDLDSIYGMAIQWRDNVKRSNWYPQ